MLGRPLRRRDAMVLVEGSEERVVAQGFAGAVDERIEARVGMTTGPEGLEGGHLQSVDLVPVDQPGRVELLPGLFQAAEFGPGPRGARDLVDAEVEGVEEAPAAGEVGARFLGEPGPGGVEGVYDGDPGPLRRRPPAEAAEVGEVSHSPARPGAKGVELGRPPPALAGGQMAGAGAQDKP